MDLIITTRTILTVTHL